MQVLHLYASVPVAGFRVAQAREFWETYPCPPPSTVYGMLLSLVGEPDRLVHQGAEVAMALVSRPQRSVVLRTMWRIKREELGLGLGANKRPDFQELLSNIRLSIWVRSGETETAPTPLVCRLEAALSDPQGVSRFGGLSLGESSHLVDEARRWRHGDPATGQMLISEDTGNLSMPIWTDHVGSKGTRWGQFRLKEGIAIGPEPEEAAWVAIRPPGG